MKRKLLCLLLAACMLLSLGAAPVSAAAPRRHSITVTAVPMAEEGITWTVDDGLLTISGKGAVPDYAVGEAPWLEEEVYSIIIEDGITGIGSNAFRGMARVQDIIVGRGVTNLGDSAFADCPKLSYMLFLGDDLTIPTGVFANCPDLGLFRFAGDLPAFGADCLNTGDSDISAYYNAGNPTWNDFSWDPYYRGLFTAYQNHTGESGTCGDDLTWQIVYSDVSHIYNYLVITGTGPMYDYAEGEAPWASLSHVFFGVYLSPGVSRIGDNAFHDMDISSVNIPGSIREIGANAFRNNPDMTYMVLRENIRKVGDSAFAHSGVNGVNVHNPNIELGIGVYESCDNLTNESFPEGMTYIPERTFKNCKNLREITIPTNVTRIDPEAFSGCTKLKTVNFYGTTRQWEEMEIAEGNDPLLNAELDGLLTNSGTCGESTTWELSEDFTVLTISGTGSVDSDPWSNAAGYIEKVIVEEGITSLAGYVLSDLAVVTEIQLPSTLTEVGLNCFYWNPKLETIELPAGLTSIGRNAFLSCGSLRSIEIPAGVTELPEGVFGECTSLETVILHEGLKTISHEVFQGCKSLREIELPSTLTTIRDNVFNGCSSLTHLEWPASIPTIGAALRGSGLTEFVVPETVTSIGDDAFRDCSQLKSIAIPETVAFLGNYTFAGTTSLESIEIPASITTIPFGCFQTSGLREITLSRNLTTIDCQAFEYCHNLERITIPDCVRVINQAAFFHCTALREVNIPAALEKITTHCFHDTALESLTIPATVKEVEDLSFAECPNLQELIFEGRDTVMTGDRHFYESPNLTIRCWYGSQAQAQAELQMIPYILFDPPADLPKYPISTYVVGSGTLTANPAESIGYEWITIEATPDEGHYLAALEVYYYAEEELQLRAEQISETTFRLLMPKCPVEVAALFQDERMTFVDVLPTDYFYDSVLWAVENGITNGTDATHFSPGTSCNRAQVVTFLWRAYGCPEPETTVNPFIDVPADSWYADPVLWAVEKGITNGTDSTHFSPNAPCNRASVVTFLWRAAGNPVPTAAEIPFTDVPADSWYADPVRWAVENGITNGMSATEFGANATCNRAQVVTFLYRSFAE